MAGDPIEARSSRLWAIFHFNLTRWIFPARMIADAMGVSTNIIEYWLVPWRRIDEHLPLSHIAEVTLSAASSGMRSASKAPAGLIRCAFTACRNRKPASSSIMCAGG